MPVIAASTASISCLFNIKLGTLARLGRGGLSGARRSGGGGTGFGSAAGGGGLGIFWLGGCELRPLVRMRPWVDTEAERVALIFVAEVMNSSGSCEAVSLYGMQ